MSIQHLPPREAHERTQNGARYVDVRTPGEFSEGHPEGALNIPAFFAGPGGMQPNPDFLPAMKRHFDSGEDIVIGCRSGGRSATAAGWLRSQGFTGELVNVLGGYHGGPGPEGPVDGWLVSGLPVSNDTTGRSWDDLK